MKKVLIIVAIIALLAYLFNDTGTTINGYKGEISDVKGNTITLVSGLHVRLLGVQEGRTDVEMFIKNGYTGKSVTLYSDSSSDQEITTEDATISAYVIVDELGLCLNHLVVTQYPTAFVQTEITDSIQNNWLPTRDLPSVKPDLALYMKQRTFLIEVETPQGKSIGTGFFINEDGLAITNWHVLPDGAERYSTAWLYKENPDDSKIYTDKKRRIKNVLWSEDTDGMDISIFSVELEQNERVAFFDLAAQSAIVGKNCSTFGNPLGFTASYSAGKISAFRDDERSQRTVNLMQYNMPTNGGNSGGPVCDDYGQIIAVHELGVKEAQGINMGIDIMQIREILDANDFRYGGK